MQLYRLIYEWKGKALGWVKLRGEYFDYYELEAAPVNTLPSLPCVPSSAGPTAGCTQGGPFFQTPYLWETWWKWVAPTWGTGQGAWKQIAAGGNW